MDMVYEPNSCQHCWHDFRGPIWMVVPDGHIVQKCCKCPATRTIHGDHAWEHGPDWKAA